MEENEEQIEPITNNKIFQGAPIDHLQKYTPVVKLVSNRKEGVRPIARESRFVEEIRQIYLEICRGMILSRNWQIRR